jgi:hypothetical protein
MAAGKGERALLSLPSKRRAKRGASKAVSPWSPLSPLAAAAAPSAAVVRAAAAAAAATGSPPSLLRACEGVELIDVQVLALLAGAEATGSCRICIATEWEEEGQGTLCPVGGAMAAAPTGAALQRQRSLRRGEGASGC